VKVWVALPVKNWNGRFRGVGGGGFVTGNAESLRGAVALGFAAAATDGGHEGGFVAARSARIGICDRVFTRMGAGDNLARGESTFMVEMRETADILRAATRRSLVLLDELGRGTSTYDGLALAWAVTEFLHAAEGPCPRTLFATHYHELTQLEGRLERLANLHATVREWGDTVVFLHRIGEGAADRSYGIHVARLAGLPESVLARAREVLGELEAERTVEHLEGHAPPVARAGTATERAAPEHPLVARLRELAPDALTPIEALNLIARWKAEWGTGDAGAKPNPGPPGPGPS
jgi:DNA mismatch repair protein MutS